MLSRAEIDRWLTLLGPNDTKLKMALETAQKLGNLMDRYTDWADLACACRDAELARDEALAWLRGEGDHA